MSVKVGLNSTVNVAQYEYVGTAHLAGTDLPEPKARWNFFEGAVSGTPYPDLDRFNRVEDSRWTGYKGAGKRADGQLAPPPPGPQRRRGLSFISNHRDKDPRVTCL